MRTLNLQKVRHQFLDTNVGRRPDQGPGFQAAGRLENSEASKRPGLTGVLKGCLRSHKHK